MKYGLIGLQNISSTTLVTFYIRVYTVNSRLLVILISLVEKQYIYIYKTKFEIIRDSCRQRCT